MKNKQFVTNKSQNERILIQCKTLVNKDAVRRESIDGVEHIIVSSATLPDDVVMNGGLYPANEILSITSSLLLNHSWMSSSVIFELALTLHSKCVV